MTAEEARETAQRMIIEALDEHMGENAERGGMRIVLTVYNSAMDEWVIKYQDHVFISWE